MNKGDTMSEKLKNTETYSNNGHDDKTPGLLDVRRMYAERNWIALTGLGLVAFGIWYLIKDWLGLELPLWSVLMLGIGGWLMFDGWKTYQSMDRRWDSTSRNRMLFGGLIALVGLLSAIDLSTWSLLMFAIASWLGYDSWKKYEASGRVWTEQSRSRATGAVVIAIIGLFGFINVWSSWPLLLIAVGLAMLFGVVGKKR
jgi:magnesium-transporting ATPase (P-type)